LDGFEVLHGFLRLRGVDYPVQRNQLGDGLHGQLWGLDLELKVQQFLGEVLPEFQVLVVVMVLDGPDGSFRGGHTNRSLHRWLCCEVDTGTLPGRGRGL
jgi:hypothetical protein